MTHTQPVLWTKGVLLDPQHLQAQDRYLEGMLQARLGAATFRGYGFRQLTLDPDALSAGTVAITAASGLMPDGLPFDIPGADAAPPARALLDGWDPDQPTLDVWLAIPEYRAGARNVALDSAAAVARDGGARFRAEVRLVRDETTGQAERPIQVAAKNLRLLVEGESREGYAALRVARLKRVAADLVTMDPDFIPPLLDLTASPVLTQRARRLVELLAAKSSALAGARRQKNQSLADFSITDVGSFWLLYNVNQAFPPLRHLAETRGGHPIVLYEQMLALASTLTTFSETVSPRQLPAYDHDDLTTTFTTLDTLLRRLLETVVPSYVVSLPLTPTQPTISAVALDDDRYLAGRQYVLAVRSALPRHELSVRVPGAVKVSSADRVDHLIRQALPGLTLTHLPNPPSEVPVRLEYEYFALDRTGEWDAIRKARNLAAYVPADIPGVALELIILLQKS